jgi:hypothetical protein
MRTLVRQEIAERHLFHLLLGCCRARVSPCSCKRCSRELRRILSMLALLLPTDAVPCEIARYMYLPMIAVLKVAGSYA